MASVDISEAISLRVNVQNLFDKRYYDRTYTTHFVNLAPGRSAFATLSLRF
jgi:catecholate siderophore receptor